MLLTAGAIDHLGTKCFSISLREVPRDTAPALMPPAGYASIQESSATTKGGSGNLAGNATCAVRNRTSGTTLGEN